MARFTGKFDNLLREFSHLRGFHQTLRSVVEQGAQSRKELKELQQVAPRLENSWTSPENQ